MARVTLESGPVLQIDFDQLKTQMTAMLESDIDDDSKAGLHNLLGSILDLKDYMPDTGLMLVIVRKCEEKCPQCGNADYSQDCQYCNENRFLPDKDEQ